MRGEAVRYEVPVAERAPYGALGAGGLYVDVRVLCSCRYRSSLGTWSGGPGKPLARAGIATW